MEENKRKVKLFPFMVDKMHWWLRPSDDLGISCQVFYGGVFWGNYRYVHTCTM
jgi:hypothetical protein